MSVAGPWVAGTVAGIVVAGMAVVGTAVVGIEVAWAAAVEAVEPGVVEAEARGPALEVVVQVVGGLS